MQVKPNLVQVKPNLMQVKSNLVQVKLNLVQVKCVYNTANSFFNDEILIPKLYMIWKTDSLSVDLYSSIVFNQKLKYIHNNPVKAGICSLPEEYEYSSADYYELNKSKWDFIADYDE